MNLVFASGFLVPQQFLGINYFRGLKKHLDDQGVHQSIFPLVDATGTTQRRAQQLADAIQAAYPTGPVHIIAHSMGGLDSRTLIAANTHGLSDPGRIASLTTLSTPHRGSPVADLLAGPAPNDLRRVAYEAITHLLGAFGLPTGALANLTKQAASGVPDVRQTHPHIRYRSYFASGRPGSRKTSFPLLPTYLYIGEQTQEDNDGVVSRSSAEYGEFQQPFWQCDHVDMIGYNLDVVHLGGFNFDHFTAVNNVISAL
jgi:triacylglycerol lipase